MPAEEEQLHQPGTSDEQQTPTPQSESTALPQATCKQEVQEAEQKSIEKDHREENAVCEKSELPKVESQPHAEQESERHTASETPVHHGGAGVSAVKEETKTHDTSLAQAQSATTQPVEEKAEPSSPPVKSCTNPSEESAGGEKVAADEEDEDDEDDEDEAPDNEEQEERGRSRDGFNNEEERAAVNSTQPHQQQHHNRQDQSQTPTGGQYYEDDEEDEEEEGEERSELRQLFEPINDSQVHSEDEEDGDYIPDEEVKKTIMVGSDFQAVIPEGLCRYDDALPYENEDKLLWNPTILNEHEIVDYLLKITSPTVGTSLTTGGAATAAGGGTGGGGGGQQQQQQQQKNSTGVGVVPDPQTNSVYAIPLGNHLRDDEQSLYLLQQCGHNIDEALRRRRITSNAVPVPEQQMSIWSEEECRNFENGLRVHGKDFHMIQQTKVRTRSVGELVQFYYLWKKTERHDLFASKARLDKKKYNLHPGLTDHMDRFLEEQENSTGFGDRSSSPGFSSLYNSASEAKRQRLLDSKENNNTASSKRGAASNL